MAVIIHYKIQSTTIVVAYFDTRKIDSKYTSVYLAEFKKAGYCIGALII